MKNIFGLILSAALVTPAFARAEEDRMAKLENRIAELEAAQSLNIFTFGGLLETRYDNLRTNNSTYGGNTAIDGNVDYLRLRASFDVNANVSKNIKVYSRFTSSKYSNLWYKTTSGASPTGTATEISYDLSVAKAENGANVYIEKFYSDVTIPDTGFVFSFGRLPTSDGPPFNQANGRPRAGTYPGLIYNSELDGLALSYNKPVDSGTWSARFVYTPFTTVTNGNGKLLSYPVITNPVAGSAQQKTMQDLDSLMVEYNTNKLSFAESMSVILQSYIFNTYIGGEELSAGAGGSGRLDLGISATALYFGLDNILNSNLDLSATYLTSSVDNKSLLTVTGLGSLGYGTTTTEKLSDSSTLVTARYKVIPKAYVGVEYLNGGKKVFIYDANGDTPAGFYSTPGTATNAYALYKFSPELGLRVGYINQRFSSTVFTFGAQKNSDRTVENYYANLRLDF